MDEDRLREMLGKSINIDLNKHLSTMDLPEFEPDNIPMKTIYLKDIVEDIYIDKEHNYIIITPITDQPAYTISPDVLAEFLPPEWSDYLAQNPDNLPPDGLNPGGQIIVPIQDDSVQDIDEEQIGNTVINKVPDYEVWMEQIKTDVTKGLDKASRKIESSLTELALTFILTQAGMSDNTQMFEGDLPP